MKKSILIILLISISFISHAQHTFERIYDAGSGIFAQRCSDGNFILGAENTSNGGQLIKVGITGDTIWMHDNYSVIPTAVRNTLDGGFIFLGTNVDTVVVIKVDDIGTIQWVTNIFDSTGQYSRDAINIFQMPDSSYAVALQQPRLMQDIPYIISLVDKNGIWHGPEHEIGVTNFVGGPFSASLIQRTKEKGFVMTGFNTSATYGVDETQVGKIDSLWNNSAIKSYVDTSMISGISVAAISQSNDGGFFIGGTSDYFTGTLEMFIMKLNTSGDSLWSKTLGDGVIYDLACTPDSGLIIISDSAGAGVIHLMKLNSSGTVVWERNFIGYGSADARHVFVDVDGGYMIIGATAGNIYFIKTNNMGYILPPASISISGLTTFCPTDSVSLSAEPGYSYLWNTLDTTETIVVHQAGSYFATITDSLGLQAHSDTVNVSLFNVVTPVITQLPGDTLMTVPGFGFQWLDQNGQPIPNADSIIYVPSTAGDYSVVVIDSNGCLDVSLPFTFIPTGIVETKNNLPLIFHNSDGILDVNVVSKEINLRIYSINGTLIKKLDMPNKSNSLLRIDIATLTKGLYILEVKENVIIRREKFIR